ncbi:MAG TPA: DUF559 domain-containing protein [Candidatus Wunengus sp. YC61]|uniref:DUF559 domain-containing protein n=1 Tax=Candidatus Wunengus sp. YC61 TaxID=3367698 RepID=UPI00402884E0
MEINDNYEWPMLNAKVAELLGKSESSIRGYKKNNKNELIKGEDYWSTSDARFGWTTGHALTVWSQNGAIKLAHRCKSDEAGIFLERMNVKTRHISHVESPSIRNIIAAIEGFTRYKRQYLVYAYKVDLYLLDWKIAVECDERDHQNYSNWKDEARQRIIEGCLNCRFVRFNPNEENFLIGKVINEIFAAHFGRESFPSV